jgi:hypothetical protein
MQDIAAWLRARGMSVSSSPPLGRSSEQGAQGEGLLCRGLAGEELRIFYRLMRRYSFRMLLREVLARTGVFGARDVERYGSHGSTDRYLQTLERIGLVKRERDAFTWRGQLPDSLGPTLEWFVAEVFQREFASEALYRVRLRGLRGGGDYDVIALWQSRLVYVETKAGPPKAVEDTQVRAFLGRVEALAPEVAIFLMDTHLRMTDKMVPMFREEMAHRYGVPASACGPFAVGRGVYHLGDRLFISNTKRGVDTHILNCLRWYLRRAVGALSSYLEGPQ